MSSIGTPSDLLRRLTFYRPKETALGSADSKGGSPVVLEPPVKTTNQGGEAAATENTPLKHLCALQ